MLYINLITDGAEILEPSEEIAEDIVEGRNTTLRCIGVGYPPPLVQWRKLNGSLSDRVSITNMSKSTNERNVTRVTVELILTRASREDTGVYECSVSNLLKSVATSTTLTIQCKQAIIFLSVVVLNSRDLNVMSKFYVSPKIPYFTGLLTEMHW